MPKIKNITDQGQAVTGIPAFAAGEIRDVSKEDADRLSRCPNFELVSVSKSEARRRKVQEEASEEENTSDDEE